MIAFDVKQMKHESPTKKILLLLGATSWIVCVFFGGVIGSLLAAYLILYTRLRWLMALYLFWIWFIDKDIGETGGRRSIWVRSWAIWGYMKEYFPLELEKIPGVELDSEKNYLFCIFPHGILPAGVFNTFIYEHSGFKTFFPHHLSYTVTLSQQFFLPFGRELMLGLGGISNTAKSIEYILSRPEGGKVCVLSVGGAKEALYSKPGTYRLSLRNKRGFVRLALRNGTPLVPVMSFGETDLYDQLDGRVLRRVQEFLRKWIVVSLVIPIGRGFFSEKSFGLIPRRYPVTTVVGAPIEVPKIADPTEEQIDELHAKFVEKLTELFEEQKSKYVKNPEVTNLIID